MQQVAQGLASLGRGDDKMLVHMTPGEVKGLQSLAMAHGGSLTINPHTGLPEAGFLRNIMPTLLGAGLAATGVGAPMAALMVGGGYGLASGSLRKGLMAGLGAYGGAGIGEGLASMGEGMTMGPNMGPQLPSGMAAPTSATAAQLTAAGYPPEALNSLPLAPDTASRATGASMIENFGIGPGSSAMPQNGPLSLQGAPRGYEVWSPDTPVQNFSQMPVGASPAINVPPATDVPKLSGYGPNAELNALDTPSKFDNMYQGAKQLGSKQGWKDLYNQPGVGATGLISAVGQPVLAAMTPTPVAMPTADTASKPNYPNYSYKQTRNPKWGQPGEPYYTQEYVPMAAGGQIQAPSMPMDLSQNYPGSNITKSSYATLPSTDSQEVVDGYGPKINPFTGAEGMAEGGLISRLIAQMQIEKQGNPNAQGGFDPYGSPPGYTYDPQTQQYTQQMAKGGIASGNLADFKMYEGPSDSEVGDLTASQLEAAADSDDPYLMGLASLERDRRKGAGTKGYKRKEFANGGIADTPEYAAGGKLLRGPGDGMSDDIPAVIKGPKPQRAALADGEFVVPADVVSHLGNGSTDAGAKRLYAMLDKVRHARTGNKKQGRQINAERFLPA